MAVGILSTPPLLAVRDAAHTTVRSTVVFVEPNDACGPRINFYSPRDDDFVVPPRRARFIGRALRASLGPDLPRNRHKGWLLCWGRGYCIKGDETAPGEKYWRDERAEAHFVIVSSTTMLLFYYPSGLRTACPTTLLIGRGHSVVTGACPQHSCRQQI